MVVVVKGVAEGVAVLVEGAMVMVEREAAARVAAKVAAVLAAAGTAAAGTAAQRRARAACHRRWARQRAGGSHALPWTESPR